MRVLVCTLASPGFAYPGIGIARELAARGHEVAIVTGPAFAAEIESAGLARIPRGPQDGPSFDLPVWYTPLAVALQVKHIEYALSRFEADVLVGQQNCLGPLLVGERRGLPVVNLGLAAFIWPRLKGRGQRPPETELRRLWHLEEMVRFLNEARTLFRLQPVALDPGSNPFLGAEYLLRSVPELEGDVGALPSRVELVGACLWEPAQPDPELDAALGEAVASGEPILYVQPGSTFNKPRFWPVLVEALAGLPCRIFAAVGRLSGELGEVPRNFFVRSHVPQGSVLPHAQAVVCSANSTAVLGALTAGCPSLLFPGGGEQPELAERCVEAGVALSLPLSDLAAEPIRRSLERVLARSCRAAALREAFARIDSFTAAAERIEAVGAPREARVAAWSA